MRRNAIGTAAALVSTALLTGAMLPLRSHLSIATTALVLVVPVVIGVASGAFLAGVVSVVVGFLVYDFFFVPPYLTLSVGAAQNWVALSVYVVVMLLVARLVSGLNSARADAYLQGREIRELFELSDLLVSDKPLDGFLSAIVTTLADVFGCDQVALLLPSAGGLDVVASAGPPLSGDQLRRVLPGAGELASLESAEYEGSGLLVVALSAAGRPIGLLALSADRAAPLAREPLLLFANHIALAVERVQLRDQALQTRLAEEVARLAKTLVTAVSHDLRAPLSAIKASSSTLADSELAIAPETARLLAKLIDVQADRLASLVQNLLDMSRIQAGVLQPRYSIASLADLVTSVLDDLGAASRRHVVRVEIPDHLPPVDADLVLVARVLTNLVENAVRHGPKGSTITVGATQTAPGRVEVSVTDHGPGVSPERRNEIFELFARRADDAGAGLGLTIAKTFVEAHGEQIWVEGAEGGGARFCFTLAVATLVEESRLAENPHH